MDKMKSAGMPEPAPTKGDIPVLPFVIEDFKERARMGEEKYGTLLETYNGRDALWDAYQEAIDLVMYLRQAILERDDCQDDTWDEKDYVHD